MLAIPCLVGAAEIVNVSIEGLVHVDAQAVLEIIQSTPGDDPESTATAIRIRDDIRAIWALGYFTNIVAVYEPVGGGYNLVYQVVEKPLISEFRYQGNKKFNKKKLDEKLEVKGRRFFHDEALAESLKQKLLAHYKEKSFPKTTVECKVETDAKANTAVLIFDINEGERLPLKKIVFDGNTVLPDKALKKRIQTKESFWFITKRQYDEKAADQDLMYIQFAYYDIGYLDAEAKLGPLEEIDGGLQITFRISEGLPYTIGEISVRGNTIFTDRELLEAIKFGPGDQFDMSLLRTNLIDMLNIYRGQGYLDNQINYSGIVERDTKNHVVNLQFQVTERPRKYLGKVELQGVVTLDDGSVIPTQEGEFRTKDFVILREIELKEGDPIDWTQVIESDRNLVNLNFFEQKGLPTPNQTNLDPGFQRVPTSDPSVENLLLQLEERETGMLTFGGGISTSFGPSVYATLTERNLFGYGIRGSITGELGDFRNRFSLNVHEPHLFNSDYSLDWDIYYIDQDGYGGRRFEEQRIGTSITLGKEIWDDELILLLGLKMEQTDLNPDVGNIYSLDPLTIPREYNLGENTTTSISFGYIYDTRDFKLDPTSGIYNRSTIEVAGLTDNEFIKWDNLVNYFTPVTEHLILALSGELNLGYAYGKPGFIPLQERYFVGGARSIRGFDEGGVGPYANIFYLDHTGGFRSYTGGESSFVGNVELRYPITEIFQAVTFLDMGSVWPEIEDIDPSDFRFSSGAGVRVRIPGLNALIRIDLAFPIREFDGDDTEFFHFSFGQSF